MDHTLEVIISGVFVFLLFLPIVLALVKAIDDTERAHRNLKESLRPYPRKRKGRRRT